MDEFLFARKSNGLPFALSRVALFFGRRMRINRNNPTVTHSSGI